MKKQEMEIHPITFKMVKKADLEKELAEVSKRAERAWGKTDIMGIPIPRPPVKPLDK